MWLDLFSLTLKRHLWNHSSIEWRRCWRIEEAIVGSECEANKAVSSANVAVVITNKDVVFFVVVTSTVSKKHLNTVELLFSH
jgi:hypothetical protein